MLLVKSEFKVNRLQLTHSDPELFVISRVSMTEVFRFISCISISSISPAELNCSYYY